MKMHIYIIGFVLGLTVAAYCLKGIVNEARIEQPDKDNPIKSWLTAEEFDRYSKSPEDEELQQLALDRFLGKVKWETEEPLEQRRQRILGRALEEYVGNLKEHEGFKVEYTGLEKGVRDMGIDLIAKKESNTHLIQCKFRANGVINEDIVHQLDGSANSYRKDKPDKKVNELLVTTVKLSDDAKVEAKKLGIEIEEGVIFKPIKCNVNEHSEKIYHLPFNKFYDKVKIDRDDEFWVETIKEAKELGFRPAKL